MIYERTFLKWIIPIVLLPLTTAGILWITEIHTEGIVAFIPLFLLVISWLIWRFELQVTLLILVVVCLPLSFEVPLSDSVNINVPSEPLLALVVLVIIWDTLLTPGYIKQLVTKENAWILPLLLCFIITTAFSALPLVSIKFSIVNLTYLLVFYVWQKSLFARQPNFFIKLLGLYSISLLAVLSFSIFQFQQYDWNPVTIRGIFRPFYKDNTIFGATSAILASFWLAYSINTKLMTTKILLFALGLIFLAGVLLSTSRAAVLSLIFSGITAVMLMVRIRIKHITIITGITLLTLVLFRSPIYNFMDKNKHLSHGDQFRYIEQLESSGNIRSDISNVERLNRWAAALGMFTERPINGFGPGTYQFTYIPYQKEKFMNPLTVKDPWHIPENSGGTAHSEYMLALSEMGILGLLALMLLLSHWVWIAFVKSRVHPQRASVIIGFIAIATYLFHSLFNNFLSTDKFAFLFWGIAAWMAYHAELKTHEQH